MRLVLLALALLAAPAQAQWQRIDSAIPAVDPYGISLVASDDAFVYAAMLTGQPVPRQLVIARSGDDGSSWQVVFEGYPGGRFASIRTSAGGRVDALVMGGGQTALLTSADHGETWTEAPARLPTSVLSGVARAGDTVVLTGGNTPYRSTDGGASWTALDPANLVGPVAFGGTFYALTNVGQPRRLAGTAWVDNPFGQSFATDLWAEGSRLWIKSSAGALYASPDGAAWTEQPTASPTAWTRVEVEPDDARPWFLYAQAAAVNLFLSDDQGATATSVQAGYPRDANGGLCISNYALTRNAVIGNAWGCNISGTPGLYRYAFGPLAALGQLDPSFGVAGRATFGLYGGNEVGQAALPLGGAAAFGGGEATLVVGSMGSLLRLRADGTADSTFGTNGIAVPRLGSVQAAFRLATGKTLVVGITETWRVNADGTLDASYGTAGVATVGGQYAAVAADGSAVIQRFQVQTGQTGLKPALVRLTPGGTLDAAFGPFFPAGRTGSAGVAVDAQGRAVALFKDGASDPTFVYRVTASGTPDAGFGAGGVAAFPDLYRGAFPTTDASGRITFVAQTSGGNGPLRLTRLADDGSVDAGFGTAGSVVLPDVPQPGAAAARPTLRTAHLGADGTLTVGGSISLVRPFNGGVQGVTPAYLARVTGAGALDTQFGTGGVVVVPMVGGNGDQIIALATDAAGSLVATGSADTGRGSTDSRALVLRAFPNVTATAAEAAPERVATRLAVWPNPTRGTATVRLTLDAPARIDVALVDALGRLVARLGEGEHAAGDVTLRLPAGLAPGVYAVRAVVGGQLTSRMVTVVR